MALCKWMVKECRRMKVERVGSTADKYSNAADRERLRETLSGQ
jgi:hypothetical protein